MRKEARTIRQVDLGATEFYAEHLERMRCSVPVSILFTDCLQTKQRAKLSAKHLEDVKQRLGHFVADFADRSIKTVTIPEIADWLQGLDLSPQTVNNYRAVIAAFFGYAVRRELVEKNPVMALELEVNPGRLCAVRFSNRLSRFRPIDVHR